VTAIVVFYLVLGMFTFAAYVKIGQEPAVQAGERYQPSWQQESGR
jgi:fumarate reductase subunit C